MRTNKSKAAPNSALPKSGQTAARQTQDTYSSQVKPTIREEEEINGSIIGWPESERWRRRRAWNRNVTNPSL